MTVSITTDQVLQLAPSAFANYRDALSAGQALLDRSGIAANSLRVAHFMAQILHESGGLTIQYENLNYSPERLIAVWPSRFRPKGPLDPQAYAHNPQMLANAVYGGRMGNAAANDGYTYRGRGLLQLTGKDSYTEATARLRQQNVPNAPDLVAAPDEVISTRWCLQVAVSAWVAKGCNALADQDNILAVTQAINGGQIGLAERAEWLKKTKTVWCR